MAVQRFTYDSDLPEPRKGWNDASSMNSVCSITYNSTSPLMAVAWHFFRVKEDLNVEVRALVIDLLDVAPEQKVIVVNHAAAEVRLLKKVHRQ